MWICPRCANGYGAGAGSPCSISYQTSCRLLRNILTAQRRARAYVHIDKSKRGYVKFVRNLRQKYPVKIIEENLQKI